jgi:hypothetical protein
MTSWNMPPGCNVTMIPGWDEPQWWPDVRCDVCGCWICNSWQTVSIKYEEHTRSCHCKGGQKATCEEWFDTLTLTDAAKALKIHPPHDWQEYDGQTNWYKCRNCGTEVPVRDF